MTKPTHTHREHGGRWQAVNSYSGSGPLEGQSVVVLHDIDKDVTSVTTYQDWSDNWRPIATDDCPVCLGSGHDQIKGRKDKPCGGCFGLGKVREDGETPGDRWELAEVAGRIIQRQARMLEQRDQVLDFPEVRKVLAERKRQQKERIDDSIAEQEQKWRDGKGRGPRGQRHTGD